jgi:MFS family permease
VNGFGVGFLGPFLTYWLTRRFDVGTAQLSVLFTLTNLVTALPYLGAAKIAARVGGVRMVVWTRLLAAGLTALVALSPTFLVAGAVYLLRMIFQTVSNPVRQSLVLEMVRPEERSRVSAISTLPSQVTMSLSPALGGALMLSAVTEDFPILGAALFQGLNAVLFQWFFHDTADPDRPRRAPVEAAKGDTPSGG